MHGEPLPVGDNILTAKAYSQRDLGGVELGTLVISFTVVTASTPVPTDTALQIARCEFLVH